ncbi:MAG: hypothetical protein AAGF95_32110 [Chloroflexota bacterium]
MTGRIDKISIWPRSGGDSGNRSQISVAGPSAGQIAKRIPLGDEMSTKGTGYIAGGAIAGDGSIRLVFGNQLCALSPDGAVLWHRRLADYVVHEDSDESLEDENLEGSDEEDDREQRFFHSLPCIIDTANTLVTMPNTALIFDAQGEVVAQTDIMLPDDSGPAPNYDLFGIPLLTNMDGSVYAWEQDGLKELGRFGYDVVPVAMFDDNSFAVAGYSHTGLCRVRRDGSLVWQSDLEDADCLPTISHSQQVAVGSLNDELSMLFAPDGQTIGTYHKPAVFAAYLDEGWIALSKDALARLTSTGQILWQHHITSEMRWGSYQPIVDSSGSIFVVDGSQVVCFQPDGHVHFRFDVGAVPGPLFPIREGMFGCVVGEHLIFVV